MLAAGRLVTTARIFGLRRPIETECVPNYAPYSITTSPALAYAVITGYRYLRKLNCTLIKIKFLISINTDELFLFVCVDKITLQRRLSIASGSCFHPISNGEDEYANA